MRQIETFNFTPISNERQKIHIISLSERLRKGKGSVVKPHRTNFYILFFVTQGVLKHLLDFQVCEIKQGDFLIIRPNQVHAFLPGFDSEGVIIAFAEDFLLHKSPHYFLSEISRFLNELSFDCPFHLDDDKREKVDLMIHMIKQELSNPYDTLQENLLQNHLSTLLLFLVRVIRGNFDYSTRKNRELLYALQFKRLVEVYVGKQSTVSYFAKELDISIRCLQKFCELHFGKSPKVIIQESLLMESKRMLIDPSLQIKQIAYKLGFNEPTNFTKFFKKYSKISPEQFRQSLF
ncbi:AraC family transcriptional regulator [Sphingobacterium sp. N143]|uniref:AraC family transcriptional regulator n=1 Tax=Sphingobacterium sp. N143 TaxID=2746727 RepID=UPI0025789A12|nr:helix-turn-helix transcriptional regulator [Sphingobacterium sp. N143]MDM1295327.1 AraC family transcriptional regulator [Sphingobacterium sp. N143]